MSANKVSIRKCSVLLVTGAGAAVCLTGADAYGAKKTGSIKDSNNNFETFVANTHVVANTNLNAFSSLAKWHLISTSHGRVIFSGQNNHPSMNGFTVSPYLFIAHNAGVTINNSIPKGFQDLCWAPSSLSDKYIAVKFIVSSVSYFGWIHVVSSSASGDYIILDKWGYETTGASIKTLADSVKTQRLALTSGKTKLHWTNTNEEGVARYEVQAQDASGAWTRIDSSAPGEGHYSVTASDNSSCRLVVEMVDGASQTIRF